MALMLVSFAGYAQEQEIRLFSHRGGRLEFDENTMSAFQASYDAGYRGFEIDVRLTKDGKMLLPPIEKKNLYFILRFFCPF